MKVGFTGTRGELTYRQKLKIEAFLETNRKRIVEVHHGDCLGADNQFDYFARRLGLKRVIHPPVLQKMRAFCNTRYPNNVELRPPKEYLTRNHDIVNEVDVLLAAPATTTEVLRSGTWATIRYARQVGLKVVMVLPGGGDE